MFLVLNSLVASLDGLIIGIGLRLANIKLTKTNIFLILLGNICIYTFFLLLYYYFHFTFMTKTISTLLYLFLSWRSFNDKEESKYQKKLSPMDYIVLTFTHSLDGTIVSLNFVYNYPLINIISMFSFMSIFILLLGYYFANLFKNTKGNYLSAILFLALAILNYL